MRRGAVLTWKVGLAWAALVSPAGAQSDADFLPGHRIVRIFVEDSRVQGSVGVELGWAIRWNENVLVTPHTSFALTRRHQDDTFTSLWGAGLRLAGTTAVAPFVELGVSAGEGLAENLVDHIFRDREENWVDTDGLAAAGFEFNTGRHWRTSIYYRSYSRRGNGVEVERSEGMGIGVTYRFARVRPPWWKVPISSRPRG